MLIYQMLPRLFGNDNERLTVNGSLQQNGCGHMNDITVKFLEQLRQLGVTHVWYTGLLEHATQTDYSSYGIVHEHGAMVKGRAGSPYAVKDYYDIDPDLVVHPERRFKEFQNLVRRTHRVGLKVIMDFVPNHVARQYHSDACPEDVEDLGKKDNASVSFSPQNNFYYFPNQALQCQFDMQGGELRPYREYPAKATGNDCFTPFPAQQDWYETVKLNYGVDYLSGGLKVFWPIPDTWHKMLRILLFWASQGVDGFRCDMAEMVPCEFWSWAIRQVKAQYPQIIWIGEVYNPDQYRDYIHQGGFDFLYDKVGLYDTLRAIVMGQASASAITRCWQMVDDIKDRMLHFLENHDEQRIASDFFASEGRRAFPALLVSACMGKQPFMLYFGQELGERGMDAEGFSGLDGRTTIFDYWSMATIRKWRNKGRYDGARLDEESRQVYAYYKKVLGEVRQELAVREGLFFDLMYVNLDNPRFNPHRTYAFIRSFGDEKIFFVVNFEGAEVMQEVCVPAHAFDFLKMGEGEYQAVELLSGKSTALPLFRDRCFQVVLPANGGVVLKVVQAGEKENGCTSDVMKTPNK